MKILLSASIFPPDIGGPAIYSFKLAEELKRRGFKVRVISYTGKKSLPKGLKHLMYFLHVLCGALFCEIIYAQNATSAGLPAVIASKIFGCRFVVKIVGDAAWERALEVNATDYRITFLNKAQKFVARSADCVIVPSRYLENMVLAWGVEQSKVRVIYNAAPVPAVSEIVSKEDAKKQIGISGDIILSIGRLVPWKGFSNLIAFMPELLKHRQNFRLVIVGEGPLYKDLRFMIDDLRLADRVKLTGAVPHEKLSLYFRAADIFVLNSSYEGLSHVILEAMAYRTPIIATNAGGNPELIEDGVSGFLAEVGNRQDLAEKILKLHSDESLWDKFILNSKNKLKKFSFERMIEETVKVLSCSNSIRQVLFIGITEYNPTVRSDHLKKKFENLGREAGIFVIARGRPFHTHAWRTEFYLLPRLFYFPFALITAIFVCVFRKIDTVVCQGPLTEGLIGTILKIVFKKELIVEVHGDWREGPFLNKKRVFAPLFKKITPFIASFSFARADKIRGVAEYFLMDLREKFPDKKYFVFPTFFDLDLFLAASPAEGGGSSQNAIIASKYICTAAVLSPIKNIETLIRAYAEVTKKFPELKLVVIGDGPSKESLQNLADDLLSPPRLRRGEKSVIFTGRLPQEGVMSIIRGSHAFALPSLSEGLPRVLLEAMALGKSVIATNVGGIPEIVRDGENGFLMEPKDVSGLAEKIEYLIVNPALAQKMGEAGRLFVQENFSNEKYIRNYITMINA